MSAPSSETRDSDRRHRARAEALRFWTPILLMVVGAAGVASGILVGGVCAQFAPGPYGQVQCLPLQEDVIGAAIVVVSGIALVAGVYLVFFNKRETYAHICAECGKAYRDGSRESMHRARGRMACSTECAERIEARARLDELRDKVALLATMAVRAPQGVERTRARERLEEIATYATEPVRTQAKEALRRIGDS